MYHLSQNIDTSPYHGAFQYVISDDTKNPLINVKVIAKLIFFSFHPKS